MRVLFIMRHAGYVRNFEGVLTELAHRGHEVHIAFETQRAKWLAGADPLQGLAEHGGAVKVGRTPRLPHTGWRELSAGVRAIEDYLRYLEPEYAHAPKLRRRAETRVPVVVRRVVTVPPVPRRTVKQGLRKLREAIPPDPLVVKYLRKAAPDVVLVTPLVGLGSTQGEYVRAAHALGIPAGVCVASWDNLTNKGLIREDVDLVAVWNHAQRREAVELHGVAPDRVLVTGAHSYDHWFRWRTGSTREQFCTAVGLDAAQPYILYLCSSPFIAPDEREYVLRWLAWLRQQPEPSLRDVGVLVRPHPQNAAQWSDVDLGAFTNVVIHPRAGEDPVDVARKSDYHDAIHHSALVVGVNTSGQIESAVLGRRVFTVLAPEFGETQGGTLHFGHLADQHSGLLQVAADFEEHAQQLSRALLHPGEGDERRTSFLREFVRPLGLDVPAAPVLADAFEQLAATPATAPPARSRLTALLAPIALLLWLLRQRPRTLRREATVALRRTSRRVTRVRGRMSRRRARGVAGARQGVRHSRRALAAVATALRPAPLRVPTRTRRVLFFLNYPGYLRYFDATIRELAERGNTVLLVFDRPDVQREGLKALATMPDTVRVVGRTPRRADVLGPVARGLRGTVDYARYLHPRYAAAEYLRDRRRKALDLAPRMRPLGRLATIPGVVADLLVKALLMTERAVPSDPEVERFIAEHDPDVVVVSPLVSEASPQTDVVKSAQAMGLPVVLCVASWDHLTTKGVVRVLPDRVVVWNQTQADEAKRLHGVPAERVVVTGAQPFDRWFDREPNLDREAFCRRVGLPDSRPFILFVGSTAGISRYDDEQRFVRRWIAALRSCEYPVLRDLAVLVRPHPYNPGIWRDADLSGLGPVAVWPRADANPVDDSDRHDYFDSMYHCAAVVGINTSAMIESAIVGRPVHTIRSDDFARTQGGTLHFHYLLPENGGFLRAASTLEEHVEQLADTLRDPARAQSELRQFVHSFVRPHGLDRPATPIVASVIEDLAVCQQPRRPSRVPRLLLPVTALVRAGAVRRRYADDAQLLKDVLDVTRHASESLGAMRKRWRGKTRTSRAAVRLVDAVQARVDALEEGTQRRYRMRRPKVVEQHDDEVAET